MRKIVLKFVISRRHPTIAMPIGARIIHVDHQSDRMLEDQVALWAECPEDHTRMEDRQFRVLGTGELVGDDWQHVGSAIAMPYIWHVYEKMRELPEGWRP